MLTCRANLHPKPDPSIDPQALRSTFSRIIDYEPCRAPASHIAYGSIAMCPKHAEEARATLRSADCLMNVRIGRGRTEAEIDQMIRPIQTEKET